MNPSEAPSQPKLRRAVAAGLVLLGAALVLSDCQEGQEVTVLRGTTTVVNELRTAIIFDGRRVGGPPLRMFDEDGGWRVAGADWFDGIWHHSGEPACLETEDRQPIEMGVLEAKATEDAPAHAVVVWLKCLEKT